MMVWGWDLSEWKKNLYQQLEWHTGSAWKEEATTLGMLGTRLYHEDEENTNNNTGHVQGCKEINSFPFSIIWKHIMEFLHHVILNHQIAFTHFENNNTFFRMLFVDVNAFHTISPRNLIGGSGLEYLPLQLVFGLPHDSQTDIRLWELSTPPHSLHYIVHKMTWYLLICCF